MLQSMRVLAVVLGCLGACKSESSEPTKAEPIAAMEKKVDTVEAEAKKATNQVDQPGDETAKPKKDDGPGGPGDSSGGGQGDHDDPIPPASSIKLKLLAGGQESVATGEAWNKIAVANPPIGDTASKGWDVRAVLAGFGATPAGTKIERLLLLDESGASLFVGADDLDPAKALPFFKLNRQGQLRFRLYRKTAKSWEVAGDLRGVHTVEVNPPEKTGAPTK